MVLTPTQVRHLRCVHRPTQEKVSKGLGSWVLLASHVLTGVGIAAALEPLQQSALPGKSVP